MSATDAPFSGEENRLREGMAETTHRVGRAGASGCPVPPGAPWPRRRHQWTLRLGALGASPQARPPLSSDWLGSLQLFPERSLPWHLPGPPPGPLFPWSLPTEPSGLGVGSPAPGAAWTCEARGLGGKPHWAAPCVRPHVSPLSLVPCTRAAAQSHTRRD